MVEQKCVVCAKVLPSAEAIMLSRQLRRHSSVGDFLLFYGLLPDTGMTSSSSKVCRECHYDVRVADDAKVILHSAVDNLERKRASVLSAVSGRGVVAANLGEIENSACCRGAARSSATVPVS